MPGPAAKTPLKLFVVVAIVAAITMACALGLSPALDMLRQRTVQADVSEIGDASTTPALYFIDVKVKVAGVDLDEEVVHLQLECIPTGDDLFDSEADVTAVKYPITLALGISEAGTQRAEVFKGQNVGGIVDVDLDLEGNVQQYPTDRHTATLWLRAYRTAAGLGPDPIPVRLNAYGAWPGLDIQLAAPPPEGGGADIESRPLHIDITRSHATSFVVYFSFALTWVLIITVIGMTVSVVMGRRDAQVAMLAFFGTLLFGLTEFRNALPGAPPAGTFSDYLAFFWAYAVVIVAVGVIGGLWLYRRSAKRESPAAPPEEDSALLDPADFT